MKREIFKVQLSLATNFEERMALVYNKSRSIEGQFPAPEDLIQKMNGQPKKFFYCRVKQDKLEIDNEAPWQGW